MREFTRHSCCVIFRPLEVRVLRRETPWGSRASLRLLTGNTTIPSVDKPTCEGFPTALQRAVYYYSRINKLVPHFPLQLPPPGFDLVLGLKLSLYFQNTYGYCSDLPTHIPQNTRVPGAEEIQQTPHIPAAGSQPTHRSPGQLCIVTF